jgi:nucleotide-binding universal stress UspA family protein
MTASRANLGKLIVGVDGSEESIDALRWAVNVAADLHTRVHAVYVYVLPHESGWMLHERPGTWTAELVTVVKAAEQELEQSIRRAVFDPTAVALTSTAVADRNAAAGLLSVAGTDDTIIVGSRHLDGDRRRLGSTSTTLLSEAHCPVIVVPKGAPAAQPGHKDAPSLALRP